MLLHARACGSCLCSTKEANLHAACVVLRVLALRYIKGLSLPMVPASIGVSGRCLAIPPAAAAQPITHTEARGPCWHVRSLFCSLSWWREARCFHLAERPLCALEQAARLAAAAGAGLQAEVIAIAFLSWPPASLAVTFAARAKAREPFLGC